MRTTSTFNLLKVVLGLAVMTTVACAEVEAEIPEVQVTQKDLSFLPVEQGDWTAGEVSAEHTFTLSSSELSWVKDLNSKIYINQIDFKATSGVSDLGFVHYAHVSMADAENVWKSVVIVDYTRPEPSGPVPVIHAKPLYPVDVSQIWTAKKILVSIALAGALPADAWTADLTVCLSGKISYKL